MADNYIFLPSTMGEYKPGVFPNADDYSIIHEIHFGPAWNDGLFGKRGEPVPYSHIAMFYGDPNRARYFEGMAEYVEAPRRIRWDPDFNSDKLVLKRAHRAHHLCWCDEVHSQGEAGALNVEVGA
jgi:hypothetical protein